MKHNLKANAASCIKSFALSLACLILSACGGGDFSDLEQKIAEIKAKPKGEIEPLPPVKVTEPFSFDLDGSRDPFKAVEKEDTTGTEDNSDSLIKPDPLRVKEDLESYALDTLKMVGTLKDSTLWALVQSTNGTIYRVKVGNYMGLNDGKIIEISASEIKLMEIVPDKDPGKWREQSAALKLLATE